MAGDWIKMRTNLDTDPRVCEIASMLNLPELHVVGCLWKIWSWADSHTIDGNGMRVTKVTLDRFCGVTGFADALRAVGWLEGRDSALTFPRFTEHNGQTSKDRSLTARRVANYKQKRGGTQVTNETTEGNGQVTEPPLPREEKRREEVLGVIGASDDQPPQAFDRKILDPINFDPWLQAFLAMWDATPGVVKQGSQISEMERREIEKRLADPWWEKNWRRALEMFPLPWFQSQGNLVGLLSFLEDGFVQKVCQRKYHNKWTKQQKPRGESKVDEIVDVISQVQEMQDRRDSAAHASATRRLT